MNIIQIFNWQIHIFFIKPVCISRHVVQVNIWSKIEISTQMKETTKPINKKDQKLVLNIDYSEICKWLAKSAEIPFNYLQR